jgi:hypothetical protein
MKLLEKALEKAVDGSKRVRDVVGMVGTLATEVHKLSHSVMGLAQAILAHEKAIRELYALNGALLKSMKEHSLDLKMPNGKKAESKPN